MLRHLKRRLNPPLHKPDSEISYEVLGTDYGGWPVVDDSLSSMSCVYSFGVGQDISFDLALIARFDCSVHAFDPTPRCLEWLEKQTLPKGFNFHPIGLFDQSKTLRFAAPPEDAFVSYTVANRGDSTEFVELPVKPLDVIMKGLGHSTIDLIKMDIEGSEYAVIADMITKGILPQQLCIEFHHGMFGFETEQTLAAVSALRNAGYRLHHVSFSGREYGFHLSQNDEHI